MCFPDLQTVRRTPLPRILILLAALSTVLCGCSPSADTAAAEQAVSKFHELLDSGRFAEVFVQSSDDLKKVTGEAEFVELLEAVHRKLGNSKSSTRQAWNVNYHTTGTFITLKYRTVYSEGEAAEQFVYRMQDSVPSLVGYHINSNTLIVK
jgi:hypothetical protein